MAIRMNILCFVFVYLVGFTDLGKASRDCTRCEIIELSSTAGQPVTRVAISDAAKIKKISLREETSEDGTCVKDFTYGTIGTDAYVDIGCSGKFKACYTKGRIETVTCASDGTPITCNYDQGVCEVESATVLEATSDLPCIYEYSFHAMDNYILVSKGCQGTFAIGCKQCD